MEHPTKYCARCLKKGRHTPLLHENELEYGLCDNCLDRMAEEENERREWEYYHPAGDDETESRD